MNEVKVLPTVLSYDTDKSILDILSIIASSAALAISGLPFKDQLLQKVVGFKDGKYLLNPSVTDLKESELRFSGSWH